MTDNALEVIPTVFNYDNRRIRVFDINGERVAVARDICDALELVKVDRALANVEDSEKMTIRRSNTPHSMRGIWEQIPAQVQAITLITEDGAVELVMQSRKPEARAFRRWLLHEVWPSIRETGSYSVAPALTEDEIVHQALSITARRVEELTAKVAELEPKGEFYDELMSAEGTYSMQVTANIVGWGRNTMMKVLRQQGILQASNVPYARWMHHFKVIPRTREGANGEVIPYHVTEVRPSGLPWLRRRLAGADV